MTKETSNKLYSFLYLFALYLGVKLLPLYEWIPIYWVASLVFFILYLGIIFLLVHEATRANLKPLKNESHLSYLWLIPLIIGCMSNLISSWAECLPVTSEFYITTLLHRMGMTLCCVVIEELLFRFFFLYFLQDMIKKEEHKDLFVILFSSLAFSFMHVVNFYGNNPVAVITQMGYTFVLGLILGFIAIYFETPLIPIIGHFLFNFLNTDLYSMFYVLKMDATYYLISIAIGTFVMAYAVILYYLARRKKEHATS